MADVNVKDSGFSQRSKQALIGTQMLVGTVLEIDCKNLTVKITK